jgi:hypothetical protein
MNDDALRKSLISSQRSAMNLHVAAGLDPEDALGAMMYVVAHFIGKVKDPELRNTIVQQVVEALPSAVLYEAGNTGALAKFEGRKGRLQ